MKSTSAAAQRARSASWNESGPRKPPVLDVHVRHGRHEPKLTRVRTASVPYEPWIMPKSSGSCSGEQAMTSPVPVTTS